jgi:phospholipase/carboxylesterase
VSDTQLIELDGPGLLYRIRPGVDETQPLVIMLHGWTGDEDGMWVFEKVLPDSWWKATFRAPHPLPAGGFSWTEASPDDNPRLTDFRTSVEALMTTIADIEERFHLQRDRFVLMGFSQGAAVAFSVLPLANWKPAAIVSLAGFMPRDASFDGSELPVFWGHGIRDEIVSIDLARQIVEYLQEMGAEVQYCEADVGHKAGLECARGLKPWLKQTLEHDEESASIDMHK